MKFTKSWFAFSVLSGILACSPASAGWGLFGSGSGSSGGASYNSSGGAYGSSGGANYAGYGSSGGAGYAGYGSSGSGSSGGYAGYGSIGAAGSSGGYSSTGGSAGSSGGSAREPGFLKKAASHIHSHFAAKHAAKRAARASQGSSGGYASMGSSGGSSGYSGYGSSGGGSTGYYSGYSTFGQGSSGGAVSYGSTGAVSYGSTGSGNGSAGSVYYGASKYAPTAAASLVSNATSNNDSVQINVTVPAEATVYVNGKSTTSTGEVRSFVSRGLESGKSYRFEIRAELANGVSDSKALVVTAGAQEDVHFALGASVETPVSVETAVTLNVPENAEVTLAGSSTKVTGTSRTFRTSQLKAGQVWEDYVIQVKVGEDVKEQSIRLIAGDKLELTFDFADQTSRLASR